MCKPSPATIVNTWVVNMNRPLVFLVMALVLGIVGATAWQIDTTLALGLGLLAWLTAGIGILRTWRYNAWVFFCACLMLGFTLTTIERTAIPPHLATINGKNVKVTGEVVDQPDVRADGVYYRLEVKQLEFNRETLGEKCILRVKIKGRGPVFKYGDVLALQGIVNIPDPPGNPGAFDYRVWLTRQGIAATLSVRDAKEVKVLDRGGSFIFKTALAIRDRLEKIYDQTMTRTQAAILKGIMFGTRGEIPSEIQQAFNSTGLVHILSVSGFHVGLVVVLVLGLLRLCRLPARFTPLVAIPLLLFYAVMTGLGPAVTRSTIMAILLIISHHIGRQQDWPTTLALAAAVILATNPQNLYDIGFQLSFVATWGLFYITPKLLDLWPGWPRALALLVAVPLAAQLATLPLVVLYFNLVSPVSILANLLTVHLVALIMLFGGMSLLPGLFYLPLAHWLNVSTGLLTDLFLWLVQWCNSLPGAAWYLPTPPWWVVVAYYICLIGSLELVHRREWQYKLKETFNKLAPDKTKARFALATLVFLIMLTAWFMWPVHNELQVHFIDVGQGDSTLIITPNNRTMLVDAGGWPQELVTARGAGDHVVVPYLHRLGINHLDVLVLTHPHADHAGGARAVLEAMDVGMVLVSPYGLSKEDKVDDGYETVIQKIKSKNIKLQPVRSGDMLNIDPAIAVRVLSPAEKIIGTRSDANNNSLILKITYFQRSVLLAGDAEAEVEEELIKSSGDLAAEVVKVPHHGSGYFAENFFSEVNPQVAVISVGANNRFGHPAARTLETLREMNCRVLRTDKQGAIILTTDGSKWGMQTGK